MYPSALAFWPKFTQQFEGRVNFLYLDEIGLVTTGLGDLVDPVRLAMPLPWLNQDGTHASDADIVAAWNAVDACRSDPKGQKQTSGLATKYGQAFEAVTTLRLSDVAIDRLAESSLAADEAMLRHYFPGYDALPADGQLAICSTAWACGAGFPKTFVKFTAAVNSGDWATALAECGFNGVGVERRIAANKAMLDNAAAVVARGLDRSTLYFPSAPTASGSGPGDSAA